VLAYLIVPPPVTMFMVEDRAAELFRPRKGYDFRYQWVAYDHISDHAKVAVIAAEDQKFSEHFGFDFESVEKAIADHERGRKLRGASTITQQVAKNLFLWPGKNPVRKGLEAYYTVLIETLWPKRRILEVYLNTAEFGNGIYGVGAASDAFFGKPPSDLTRYEAALLAGVLPSPKRLHADRPSDYLERRTYNILIFMRRIGGTEYLGQFWGGAS
jgi:monofunctional biosynthetic peptidoglycan transglycosylase